MSKLNYYAEFQCSNGGTDAEAQEEASFLVTQLIKGVHHAIVQECGAEACGQNKLALAFPLAKDGYHGGVLRVFSGDKDVLERMLRHPAIYRFARSLFVSVQETPSDARFESFSRNRARDHTSPSARRRDQRRAAQGKVVTAQKERAGRKGFAINASSESTRSAFRLEIVRSAAESGDGGMFTSYGLAVNRSAVPAF